MAAFRERAHLRGVSETHLWAKAHLEDLIFQPENDHLLFAYFGISLGVRRTSALQHIRKFISIKRKLMRAFKVDEIDEVVNQDALIRDAFDRTYPEESNEVTHGDAPPWEPVSVVSFFHGGIVVSRWHYLGRVTDNGKWDILDASAESPVNKRLWQEVLEEQRERWHESGKPSRKRNSG
jgi:hypothetical protein